MRTREVVEADRVEVAPAGVTVGSLRRLRAALIGPPIGKPENHP